MFCEKCGARHEDDAAFCSNCGAKFNTGRSNVTTIPTAEEKARKVQMGRGLVAGGLVGAILFAVAAFFLYNHRLREVQTRAFLPIDSNEVNRIMVGIENWLPLFILALFLMVACLFLIKAGLLLIKENQDTDSKQ